MHFRNLKVWQKAHSLTLAVYRVTRVFPKEELYGLTSQIRRACASVEANLAEGSGRVGSAEYARFVQISLGSARELECELLIARDLDYLTPDAHQPLQVAVDEVQRMLTVLSSRLTPLKAKSPSGQHVAD